MRIAVVVPTFRRPEDLRRCLSALERQVRPADQMVVVARPEDGPTHDVLNAARAAGAAFETVLVSVPGMVQALNAGFDAVEADVVAFTDDDAAPHPDWLSRIEAVFRSAPEVGGVGGRDAIGGRPLAAGEGRDFVGRVSWFGRMVGNHHLGHGPARFVDVLKGVNHAYRTPLLRELGGFDRRLKGIGAQVHSELEVGLALASRGWKLLYDPEILVDHSPAPRHSYDQREVFHPTALSDEVHNETVVLLRHLSWPRRAAYTVWSLLCGTRVYPGVVCWAMEAMRRNPNASHRFAATLRGRGSGAASWLREYPRANEGALVTRDLDGRSDGCTKLYQRP